MEEPLGKFDGQVVWITGGGSGIGRALALEFAAQGADVAVSGRRLGRLEQVALEIDALGRKGLAVRCDVTSEDDISAAVSAVTSEFGRLDVAVANAGCSIRGRVADLTLAQWRRQLDINVIGVAMTAAGALPELEKTGGRVAVIGSVMAFLPVPAYSAYNASKAAVRAIGTTLSVELSDRAVSCTTIHPGYVASEIAQVDNDGVFDPNRVDKRPATLIWPTEKAARVMVRAIHARKRELVFTAHGRFAAFMARHCPGLVHHVLASGRV